MVHHQFIVFCGYFPGHASDHKAAIQTGGGILGTQIRGTRKVGFPMLLKLDEG